MRSSYTSTSVEFWARQFGYSRQSYYKNSKRQEQLCLEEVIILQLVFDYRKKLPRTGTRKLYHALKDDIAAAGIKLGRDGLHRILSRNGLTIRTKRRATKTTTSYSWYRKYPDRRQGLKVLASELLWCADITYLRIQGGFVYLSLVTDEYSRKIVGWCCHPTLETVGCLRALNMAIAARKHPRRKLIHHSDRGSQYCSEAYTERLLGQYVDISVTQSGSPYDNPMAESMNAQLKVELGLDRTFETIAEAISTCQNAILLYNTLRQHGSLNYLTPEQAYNLQGEQPKKWNKAGKEDTTTRTRTAQDAVNLLQAETNNVNYRPVGDF